jgi:hypothetical protein
MGTALDRLKVSALLVLLAGYLILDYPFMLLRIPPVGFGIPLGEVLLVIVLLGINPRLALSRLGCVTLLAPFLVWWGWGLGRLAFDAAEHGMWALRDATSMIESLYVLVGFSLAADPRATERLIRWLYPIIVIGCSYCLLYVFADQLAAISPTILGASGQAVPIFGAFAMAGTMLLWAAFACLITPTQQPHRRLLLTVAAGFLIAFAMIVLQKRTTYLQLAGLAALLLYVRPRALSRLGITLPLLGFALLVITAFDIRISGRLTSEISLSFFLDHLLAIVGIGTDEQGAIADAASGVPLRLHWWTRIYEQLTSDPIALIGGLGYGIPLTDFRDTLGVVTREPHNSVISVVARLGLIGLLSWITIAFFRAGFQVYWISRRRGYDEISRLALLVIAFAILTLVGCVGEDNMEKPFFAIPFYTLWGFILRIAYQLRGEVAGEYPAAAGLRIARSEYP